MNTEEPIRWYKPHDAGSAVDAVEDVKSIVSFLSDCITQEGQPCDTFSYSEDGQAGLHFIYSFIEGVLDDCVNILVKEVKR